MLGRLRLTRDRLRHWRVRRSLALPKLLGAFAAAHPDAFFVEIGANDGVHEDHLRPFVMAGRWRGIMVEPVPYIFERLARNYAGVDRVTLANVAIAAHDGELPFFHLRDASAAERADLPGWYDGIGSFDRDALLRHAVDIPDVADRIVEARVPTVTFDALLERHGAPPVDLVVIDTEGYDAEVLRSIDLSVHRPALLVYEHYHLDAQTRADTRAYVEGAGYETMEEGFDTLCIERRSDLLPFWRGLEPGVAGVVRYEEPFARA
jgi:FkbM family methyltransferase